MITSVEKEILGRFVEDELLMNTVKKMLLEEIIPTDIKPEWTNDQIGAIFRAYTEARQSIKKGFQKMKEYKQVDQKPPKVNEAR